MLNRTAENLKNHGFAVQVFETAKEAGDYLVSQIHGTTVGIGGSVTVKELDIYDRLKESNTVYSHTLSGEECDRNPAFHAPVYILSANGVSETGELVNIDGNGNRLAASLYDKDAVYFVVGKNKIAPDLQGALWRAQNIAAPKNAQRLKRNTPCAVKGDKCYDCNSPQRLCRGATILWRNMNGVKHTEVILINEELGY